LIKIIKNAKVYTPNYIGINDVALVGDKISSIGNDLTIPENNTVNIKVIDGEGKILVPGFIDSHVHILGGGGEGGFKTRTPQVE